MTSCPKEIQSQVKLTQTGVDEQAGILLKNQEGEMATIIISLQAKQPKRGLIAFDQAYIEISEYPRGTEAVITYTEDGHKERIEGGKANDALCYEIADMEQRVLSESNQMYLELSRDVMEIMTRLRKQWKVKYPEEE